MDTYSGGGWPKTKGLWLLVVAGAFTLWALLDTSSFRPVLFTCAALTGIFSFLCWSGISKSPVFSFLVCAFLAVTFPCPRTFLLIGLLVFAWLIKSFGMQQDPFFRGVCLVGLVVYVWLR